MGRPVYNWIIVYNDGGTETVSADNPMDAVDNVKEDWYYKGIRAVIRMDYA